MTPAAFAYCCLFICILQDCDKQVAVRCYHSDGVGHSGSSGLPQILQKMSHLQCLKTVWAWTETKRGSVTSIFTDSASYRNVVFWQLFLKVQIRTVKWFGLGESVHQQRKVINVTDKPVSLLLDQSNGNPLDWLYPENCTAFFPLFFLRWLLWTCVLASIIHRQDSLDLFMSEYNPHKWWIVQSQHM